MKKVLGFLLLILTVSFTSCTSVDPKERGVEVSWGGEVNMSKTYPPGMHYGMRWLTDELVTYDVSEKTTVEKYEFNDSGNMTTGVEIAVDYSLSPDRVQFIHTKITDYETKLKKTIKSAAKEVIPQYTASELNLTKRNEAEDKISKILAKELPEFYLVFNRVQLTDVDIPAQIAKAAEQTARQTELNKLALSKVTEAENNYKAAEFDAKTKDVLSKPAMLELKRLEIQMEYARRGVSPYGTNNVFGTTPALLLNR